MISPKHFRQLIVDPPLKRLNMYSESSSNIMMGTAATESHLGKFLMQIDQDGNPVGPALGPYEMEGATHDDIWKTYILRPDKGKLKEELGQYLGGIIGPQRMVWDFRYATVMARLKYWRDSEPLPEAGDIEGLGHIYKRVFNSAGGKGSVEKFVNDYQRFVMED